MTALIDATDAAIAEIAIPKKKATAFSSRPSDAGWLTKTVLIVMCVAWMLPVVGTFVTSLRTPEDTFKSGWWSVFTNTEYLGALSFKNYSAVMQKQGMADGFINSMAITLPATFIPLLVASFAAYAFTFMQFKGRDTLFLLIVSLLVVPNYVAFVPLFKLYSQLGIAGTFPAAWLAHVGFGLSLAIYLLRNQMAQMPRSIIESAQIDGATHWQRFFQLVLPMATPAIASFAIFQFLWVWNDLLVALVFLGPGQNAPVTVTLSNLLSTQGDTGWELILAGAFLTLLVPMIVFFALQRFFVRGMTAGAVKG